MPFKTTGMSGKRACRRNSRDHDPAPMTRMVLSQRMAAASLSRKGTARRPLAKPRRKRPNSAVSRRSGATRRWRGVRAWVLAFGKAPGFVQLGVSAVVVVMLWLCVNWVYQVVRKPSELLFPVSGTLFKTPSETWHSYAPIFRQYSTPTISAEFLAALAQAEGAGNPVARTYWRWSWSLKPFELYRPASSSVGMYQMTDGTFGEARQLCVRRHVVEDSCWFNGLYMRVLPSHAVELTSALLDRQVTDILERHRIIAASPAQKLHLAAAIHLCGAGAADLYARHGFRFAPGQRCGDHDPRAYLAKVDMLRGQFARLAHED